jgi:hypothetical protein
MIVRTLPMNDGKLNSCENCVGFQPAENVILDYNILTYNSAYSQKLFKQYYFHKLLSFY